MYATGTVNIRESYTADSNKLGSLSVGQSIVRTGTSIAGTEAEGWSRIQLSDGSIVYVSSNYISTTKQAFLPFVLMKKFRRFDEQHRQFRHIPQVIKKSYLNQKHPTNSKVECVFFCS